MFSPKFKIQLLHDDMYHVMYKKWYQRTWRYARLSGFLYLEEAEAWLDDYLKRKK